MTLLLKKTWIHFHQGCFEPDLVKIGPLVFWRAKFLNGTCINVLSLFPNYLPFIWRHLNSLYPNKGMAIQLKCEKFMTKTPTTTKFQSEKLTWPFGPGELKNQQIILNKIQWLGYLKVCSYIMELLWPNRWNAMKLSIIYCNIPEHIVEHSNYGNMVLFHLLQHLCQL